jgi:hypothetical protein
VLLAHIRTCRFAVARPRRRVDLSPVVHSTLGLQTSQLELNRIRVVTA